MLNRQTNTNTAPAEAAPILTTLPKPLAVQLVREMIHLAEKRSAKEARLTFLRKRMAYFSSQGISRPPLGRPLGTPTATFAALLYSRLSGYSRRRAEEIINTSPTKISGAIWSVAAQAAADGVQTSEQFESWLQREEQPSQS